MIYKKRRMEMTEGPDWCRVDLYANDQYWSHADISGGGRNERKAERKYLSRFLSGVRWDKRAGPE